MGYEAGKLEGVLQPVARAKGLPNEHYIDQATFDAEREAVFFANWAAVGFGKDVPEEADAKPFDFLGLPLLMVRGRDGIVRVFQNTCRHRGMILVSEPKKMRGVIRCPRDGLGYRQGVPAARGIDDPRGLEVPLV